VVWIRLGQKLGRKWASPQAIERGERLNARLDSWAARHRLLVTSLAAVFCGWFAWYLSVRRDGATTGEIVFWELIVVPVGTVSAWIAVTRLRRRRRPRS
jgi:hypothetical protein